MSIDIYPSTFDCPVEERGDLVLSTLIRGRARYEGASGHGGYLWQAEGIWVCCAVGSIAMADGLTEIRFSEATETCSQDQYGTIRKREFENLLSAAAREAMATLDEVAADRHIIPPPEEWREDWTGPFEWVHEELCGAYVRKETLAIYDIAINKRKEMLESARQEIPELLVTA